MEGRGLARAVRGWPLALCLGIATVGRAASLSVAASRPAEEAAGADVSSLSTAAQASPTLLPLDAGRTGQSGAQSVFPPSAVLATSWASSGLGIDLEPGGNDRTNGSANLPERWPSLLISMPASHRPAGPP